MNSTDKTHFNDYVRALPEGFSDLVDSFNRKSENFVFGYRIQASAVFSSNIEGNTLNLNSYMNLKMQKELEHNKKEVSEIDELVEAYHYARSSDLNESTFLEAHRLLSRSILAESQRGKYRKQPIGVFDENGLVYLAVEDQYVDGCMSDLFAQIATIRTGKSTIEETLYYAALVHLRFVHIHPFVDGNGRAARLLEKWFLATLLGSTFWNLLPEKYYKEHQTDYCTNIDLGVNFYELDYSKCMPFLLMLPESLRT